MDAFYLRSARIYAVDLPFKQRFQTNLISKSSAENIYLRLESNLAIVGWGEGNPHPVITGETREKCWKGLKEIIAATKGRKITDLASLKALALPFREKYPTAAMVVEMALLDLYTKAANMPLWRIWASEGHSDLQTDITLSMESPEQMAETARGHLEAGFSSFKLKVGTDEDEARLQAVRQAIGPNNELKIDANQAWSVRDAPAKLKALTSYDIALCEQPIAKTETRAMAELAEQSPILVMADEALAQRADGEGLVGSKLAFNVKASKAGGLLEAAELIALAAKHGIPCQLGCMTEGTLAMTAFAQLAAAFPSLRWLDLDGAYLLQPSPVKGGITYGPGGRITLPSGAGIGAEPQASFLSGLRSEQVSLK